MHLQPLTLLRTLTLSQEVSVVQTWCQLPVAQREFVVAHLRFPPPSVRYHLISM